MARPKSFSSTSCTIVIKLGTSSIVHETTHQPLLSTLSAVVETVLRLRADGHKVVLVSSGAIGVGLKTMNMPSRPKSLAGKQALAAIGQGRLIALWDNLFSQLGQPIAQVLLTRGDISDRTRYLNAVNTFTELLNMGVVPIVNENDTISVSEIKFGDNDTLSAITASMLHADYLFLLTDVDGLYTTNPRKDPDAKRIDVVSSVASIRAQVSTSTLGSKLGTGGMETKLIAAEIATAAGVTTIINSSKKPDDIFAIIQYNSVLRAMSATGNESPMTSNELETVEEGKESSWTPPATSPNLTSPSPSSPNSSTSTSVATKSATPTLTPVLPFPRPPHTTFTPSPLPLRDLKSWTSHTLSPSGSVIVDPGAYVVLSRRDSGGRLLPAGVVGVEGAFASGQAVRIIVRMPQGSGASAAKAVVGQFVHDLVDGWGSGTPGSGAQTPVTRPVTPTLMPSASLTSSISSIGTVGTAAAALGAGTGNVGDELTPVPSSSRIADLALTAATKIKIPEKEDERDEESFEYREVGRGLANYNSAQIAKVKGLKSSYIVQLLGYADSEYVVENITIRVPP